MIQPAAPIPCAERCAILLAEDLTPGLATNGAALLALTAGQRYPDLIGEAIVDADRDAFPGMCPTGIPVLAASAAQLSTVYDRARAAELEALILPAHAQRTTRYDALLTTLAESRVSDWTLAGVMLVGPAKSVRELTRGFYLWGVS